MLRVADHRLLGRVPTCGAVLCQMSVLCISLGERSMQPRVFVAVVWMYHVRAIRSWRWAVYVDGDSSGSEGSALMSIRHVDNGAAGSAWSPECVYFLLIILRTVKACLACDSEGAAWCHTAPILGALFVDGW